MPFKDDIRHLAGLKQQIWQKGTRLTFVWGPRMVNPALAETKRKTSACLVLSQTNATRVTIARTYKNCYIWFPRFCCFWAYVLELSAVSPQIIIVATWTIPETTEDDSHGAAVVTLLQDLASR